MGLFSRLTFAHSVLTHDSKALEQVPATKNVLSPQFGTVVDPGVLYGVQSLDDAMTLYAGHGRVSRREAISVPAVKAARDLIAGGLGQLPLQMLNADNQPIEWTLLSQPEESRASNKTWTSVVDDLLFYGHAWLRITHMGWHGKPAQVVRLDPASVTVQPDHRVYQTRTGGGTALEWLPDNQLIHIESPNDPILEAGARAIRALGRLEIAALNAAEGVPPVDFFTPAPDADPDPDDVADFLTQWQTARQTRTTGYVGSALEYHVNGWNPEQLQLQSAREMAIGEIARLTGVDAEALGLSVTSRDYYNAQDRDRVFVRSVLGPFIRAIESRLSMDDVTPHGYRVRFDVSEFVKADDKTTAETDAILIGSGVQGVNEIRARRGLEPIEEPAPQPQESNTEVPENV